MDETKQPTKVYRCYLCSAPSDGLLCDRCRSEIDRGQFDRVVSLSGLDKTD